VRKGGCCIQQLVFLPLLYSDASCTFTKEMAILKFPRVIMSVVMSMRLPLVKYYRAVVSPRILGSLLRILFYSFLLSSFFPSLLYSIPFHGLHPYSEKWLIQPDCTVLGTTFIHSNSNTKILGTLYSNQFQKKPKYLTAELTDNWGREKRISRKLDLVSAF
jgi:hypothetical protein